MGPDVDVVQRTTSLSARAPCQRIRGVGTLLDNTLLLFVNEISRGNTHSHEDMPFILAGGAGGALNAGRYLRYDNENHLRLLQSVLELMDVDSSDFGLREFRSLGPLPGIL